MDEGFRILFADDEETFLYSTCELLRRAGYRCDSAVDVKSARSLLQQHRYDLVIADVKMPGNHELQFARQLSQLSRSVSIILVTGHPSLTSAVESLELPVVAYLIKPFDFQDLLNKVRTAAERARVRRVICRELDRLHCYRQDLINIEYGLDEQPRFPLNQSLQALVGMTLRTVAESLANLQRLADQADPSSAGKSPSMPGDLQQALHDAVSTLERTKTAFKSKELGELRKRLETLLLRN